jgi:uncharacterized protein YjbI with pentapeptide repeats
VNIAAGVTCNDRGQRDQHASRWPRSGANLTAAILSGVVLSKANLVSTALTKANLTNADLTGAILAKANFTDAALPAQPDWHGC